MTDYSDVETVSAYEVGSVQFLTNLQQMEAWVEPGVPVSGDATACLRHRQLGADAVGPAGIIVLGGEA